MLDAHSAFQLDTRTNLGMVCVLIFLCQQDNQHIQSFIVLPVDQLYLGCYLIILVFVYTPTDEQLADFMTKPLDVTKFQRFRDVLLSVLA